MKALETRIALAIARWVDNVKPTVYMQEKLVKQIVNSELMFCSSMKIDLSAVVSSGVTKLTLSDLSARLLIPVMLPWVFKVFIDCISFFYHCSIVRFLAYVTTIRYHLSHNVSS